VPTDDTSPLADTATTEVLELDQVALPADTALPDASSATAVACVLCPIWIDDWASVTRTDATGATGATSADVLAVIPNVPMTPSTVALTAVVPPETAVTRPLAETVAMAGEELAHVTLRPVSATPWASRGIAVSCTVCPTVIFVVGAVTLTDAGAVMGAVTVRLSVPLFPSLVAVTTADPAPTATASPDGEMPITAAFELDQATVRPESELPAASRRVTEIACVWPTSMAVDDALSVTVDTGAGAEFATTSVAELLMPSLVATMETDPGAIAATLPLEDTVARVGSALLHVIVRPVRTLPAASRVTATACVDWPTLRFDVLRVTLRDATGAGGGGSTDIVAAALLPSTDALMVAFPLATAVTRPLVETVATVGFELLHEGAREASTLPAPS
jgi:hypothetical protein